MDDRGAVNARAVVLPGRGTTTLWSCPGRPGAPTVILLHGVTLTAELNWSAVMTTLEWDYQVLAFDQRGHGRGLGHTGHYRLEDCADDVADLAALLGIDRMIVAGYSMGGLIAQLVWRRHPQLTAGLVLCATARNMADSPWAHSPMSITPVLTLSALAVAAVGASAGLPLAPALDADLLRADLLGTYLLERGVDHATRARALTQMRRTPLLSAMAATAAVYQFSSHTGVGDIDVPTAVLIPRWDRVVPPSRQHRLAAAIPHCFTYNLDGDHCVFLTDPDHFTTTLQAACHAVSAPADDRHDPALPATAC